MILVPTDFSDNANNAVEYALEIARVNNQTLMLLHVVHSSDFKLEEYEESERTLEAMCAAMSEEYPGISCTIKVVRGDIVTGIIETAKTYRAKMIVMGTEGVTNLGKLFFGSNTAAVIEEATCPVLSIPNGRTFSIPERMVFATNFSRDDIKGAAQLVELAKAFDASIVVAHVSVQDEREDIEKSMIQIFSREVSLITDYHKINYRLSSDNTVSMGLDSILAETKADWIALSTRKRGVFEKLYNPSLTQKFSLHANIPLLAFHAIGED